MIYRVTPKQGEKNMCVYIYIPYKEIKGKRLRRTVMSQRFLQTIQLACHGFMDAGTSHETPGSERKDFMICGTASYWGIMFVPISLASKSYGGNTEGPWWTLHAWCVCGTAEEPQTQEI